MRTETYVHYILWLKIFRKLVLFQTLNPPLIYAILKFDSQGQYMTE